MKISKLSKKQLKQLRASVEAAESFFTSAESSNRDIDLALAEAMLDNIEYFMKKVRYSVIKKS